jgi:hypothetical protein
MKRISSDGFTLVTGSEAADALLKYAEAAFARGVAVNVELAVLEADGAVRPHTIVFGPAAALDVVDLDGRDDEADVFPLPVFPARPRPGQALPREEVLDLELGAGA